METIIKTTHFSEEIVTQILARLPLRSISRFKLLSKTWKSTLESPYFRRLFVSLHKNSSSTWSLMSSGGFEEIIGLYGCETWDIPKSLASYLPTLYLCPQRQFQHMTFSNGLILIKGVYDNTCFVGNPLLQQWIKIPPPRVEFSWLCLVTRMDEDDCVVSSFKVVNFYELEMSKDYVSQTLSVDMFSSETGIWTSKQIHCPFQITNLSFVNLNGTLYFYYLSQPGVFVAHDFYSDSDHFRVVHYPDMSGKRRVLTTSGGFVMYVRTLGQEEETGIKVWRLKSDDSLQILWEIGIPVIGNYYVPLAMHAYDNGIVYLWSLDNPRLLSCNLRTRSYKILGHGSSDDDQDCVVDYSVCEMYMDEMWRPSSSDHWEYVPPIEALSQFVLPRWMESMPCPPEVEMINTASLLPELTSIIEETRIRMGTLGDNDYF